jgi:hypothetical protein
MQSQPVFLRVDPDGAQAKLGCGTENPYRNLAAVRSQQFSNGPVFHHHRAGKKLTRNSTLFHAQMARLEHILRFAGRTI